MNSLWLTISAITDHGRPVRKSPSLHGRKPSPTPKFLGMAEAYFICHSPIGPNFQISLIDAFIGCPQSVSAMKECNLSARASRAELIILHTQRKLSVIDRLCDVYRLHFCTVQCRKKGYLEKRRLFATNDSALKIPIINGRKKMLWLESRTMDAQWSLFFIFQVGDLVEFFGPLRNPEIYPSTDNSLWWYIRCKPS